VRPHDSATAESGTIASASVSVVADSARLDVDAATELRGERRQQPLHRVHQHERRHPGAPHREAQASEADRAPLVADGGRGHCHRY
jgi:hypothetical protein